MKGLYALLLVALAIGPAIAHQSPAPFLIVAILYFFTGWIF